MITIQGVGSERYAMRFSDSGMPSYQVEARSLVEVHQALDHHMAGAHAEIYRDKEDCPLCRLMKVEWKTGRAK